MSSKTQYRTLEVPYRVWNTTNVAIYPNPRTVFATFSRKKPSPLDVTEMTITDTRNTGALGNSAPPVYPDGRPLSAVTTTYYQPPNDVQDCLLRAKRKFTERQGQLGESLMDIGETSEAIEHRVNQFSDGMTAVAKGRWKDAARIFGGEIPRSVKSLPAGLKRLAGGYLEFSWGWMPLIQDIYTIMTSFDNRVKLGQTVHGSSSTQGVAPGTLGVGYNSVRISAKVKNPTAVNLSQLGLANPLLVAWEALPFSFLIDWFLPISDILASLMWDIGLDSTRIASYAVSGNQGFSSGGVLVSTFTEIDRKSLQEAIIWSQITNYKAASFSIGKVVAAVALLGLLLL